MYLSHQTSRQPVHLYWEVPRGYPHLLLVFNLSLWKDGNSLIPMCRALPQLTLRGKSSLLAHAGSSYSQSFLNARPKEDPASLNCPDRPPLTSSCPSGSNKQFASSQAFWAGGWGAGGLARLPLLCILQGGFKLGPCETILEEEAERRMW